MGRAAFASALLLLAGSSQIDAFSSSGAGAVRTAPSRPAIKSLTTADLPAWSSSSCLSMSTPTKKDTEKETKPMFSFGKIGASAEMDAAPRIIVEEENWELDSKVVELVFLAVWLGSLSTFIFINNWAGPWPAAMKEVPERVFFLFHMLGGTLFGGGVIMTTALEWLVVKTKNVQVLQFYFDKVPLLDAAIVLPGLTMGMISGTGLTIRRYGGLGIAPPHVPVVFYILTAFAAWWAITDLATQGKALRAVDEWAATAQLEENPDVPKIVEDRFISNIVSCGFVVLLYSAMVLKPGTLPQYTPHIFGF